MSLNLSSPPLDRDTVLAVFDGDENRALKVREIGRILQTPPDDRSTLRQLVRTLVEEGDLVALPARRFAIAQKGTLVEGRVQRHPKGYGWLLPEDEDGKDAFLPPDQVRGLCSGDLVLCRIEPAPKGPVAYVEKVLARGRATLTGTLRRDRKALYVEAGPNTIDGPIMIPAGDEGGATDIADGMVVEVLIERWPTSVTAALGRVIRTIGKEGNVKVEIESILTENGIVRPFAPEAEAAAAELPATPDKGDYSGREDLRTEALCTIDGATAKDFDDAVLGVPVKGGIEVTVAIADVAHYVREHEPLDVDAQQRSTSVYYPGHCIPMLPEALSNGLCSLVPHQDRLCMVARFVVGPKGAVSRVRLFQGVMHSHARLTYKKVQAFFDVVDSEGNAAAETSEAGRDIPLPVRDSLHALRKAALALRSARRKRGSQDFDLPEPFIEIGDDDEPVAITTSPRGADSNRLIEDLMIAANEAVATFFEERDWPCVYRIHEPPDADKLERVLALAKFVVDDPQILSAARTREPAGVARLMNALGENPKVTEPVQQALQSLMLRAMMQARYSADNVGHFGLGSDAYLHFTSPIRRYPDLLVHRRLKAHLHNKRRRLSENETEAHTEKLEQLAAFASVQERKALDAERAIIAMYGTRFCQERIGEEHEGVVTGVAEFGAFVRLAEHHVEGMCHVSGFSEYMEYDEVRLRLIGRQSGRIIQLGDRVRVLIAATDIQRRQVSLKLLSNLEDEDDDDSGDETGESASGGDASRDSKRGHRKGKQRVFARGTDDEYRTDPEEEARLRREHYERMRAQKRGAAPMRHDEGERGRSRRNAPGDGAKRDAKGGDRPVKRGRRVDDGEEARGHGPRKSKRGAPKGSTSGRAKTGGKTGSAKKGGAKSGGAKSGGTKKGAAKKSGSRTDGAKKGGASKAPSKRRSKR